MLELNVIFGEVYTPDNKIYSVLAAIKECIGIDLLAMYSKSGKKIKEISFILNGLDITITFNTAEIIVEVNKNNINLDECSELLNLISILEKDNYLKFIGAEYV